MKKILIPTDFSENASDAFFYATKVFGGEKVEFIVVYSFENEASNLTSRVDIGKSEYVLDKLHDDSILEGNSFIDKMKQKLGKTQSTFRFISTGMGIFRAVNKLIKEEEIALTVMGTKGRTADENILVGSTTSKMITKIKGCSLLIVPSISKFEAPLKVGFATDFSTFYPLQEVPSVNELILNFNSTLEILYVGEESTLSEEQLKTRDTFKNSLDNLNVHFCHLKTLNSISESLAKYTLENRLDLLILVNRKHNIFNKLFREAVIKRVGNKMEIPYLLLPVN